MTEMNRQSFLAAIAATTAGLTGEREAAATLLRGLSLEQLSKGSDHIVVGTALDASSHWEVLGGRRRIVTDIRVRVDDVVAQAAPSDIELQVRTLGGTIGDVAALVHGEAQLSLNEPCLLFLSNHDGGGVRRVFGMAQGHYPMQPDASQALRLLASPRMPELIGSKQAQSLFAVRRLVGQEFSQARALVREAIAEMVSASRWRCWRWHSAACTPRRQRPTAAPTPATPCVARCARRSTAASPVACPFIGKARASRTTCNATARPRTTSAPPISTS
ncbi:MAG: hypothetical protein QM756_12635 [Polyangiaceae bacterium]